MIELKVDHKVFESQILSFQLSVEDLEDSGITEDYMLEMAGDRYFVTKIVTSRSPDDKLATVEAEAAWMRLADIRVVGSVALTTVTPSAGLTQILAYTDWTVDECTADSTTFSLAAQDTTVLDLLWEWAKICGCEIEFNTINSSLKFNTTVGTTVGLQLRYGYTMTEVKRTVKPPATTRLYAFGRFGLNITALTPSGESYVEDYSWYTDRGLTTDEARTRYRKDAVYSDDSFLTDDALYAAAQARLALLSQGEITYEVSVPALREILGIGLVLHVGDTLPVYDGPLNVDAVARVTRTISYPDEPHRDKVELGFSKLALPDTNISDSRTDTGREWELIESRFSNARHIRLGSTILHRIPLTAVENAQWVVGFKLQGLGVGSAEITLQFNDDQSDTPFMPDRVFTVTDGVYMDYEFTYGQDEVPAGEYLLVVRANSDGALTGLNCEALESALWVLARGTNRSSITLENTELFEYTGAVQYFTVPDDVEWVTVTCVAAAGGPSGATEFYGGMGGMVEAKIPVVAGDIYPVYVGGLGTAPGGGWPNGGSSLTSLGNSGYGGGGASYVLTPGSSAITDALIVAGAGGGHTEGGASRQMGVAGGGGAGGFLAGITGQPAFGPLPSSQGGDGATQEAPGLGGIGESGSPTYDGEDGDVDGQGQGGDTKTTASGFAFQPGGGGGGWHGGGGGGSMSGISGFYGGDGGGGSGYVSGDAWDLYYEDAYEAGNGWIRFSWETPET